MPTSPELLGSDIKIVFAWSYANAAARTAASGFTLEDQYKFALQRDDNSIWMLVSTSPEWISIGSGAGQIIDINLVIKEDPSVSTGVKLDVQIDFNCVIVSATLLADAAGSIIVDIWKDTYANFPPTVADTITASAKPTLSTAMKSQDTALTGWITTINAGDILRINVDSASGITRATLILKVRKV